ncbi:dicarboxylate/amino acid:cation symporter [Glycomyces albidus]|jgi:Na+/H+-dicarboxylate symporter|uniref:Cation:dicarboxylase symporter family transporter n=1 Tax=Glycomyces albidus TaxID=2656774 RepID=A0A6L5GBY7_9ACTN|nr:dicarboxylate/amino acid:cation symporter [Glycomyces albidus]MQM27120.1 cation:dicarboxylase symporter family transporter [Glycomyces albidus]
MSSAPESAAVDAAAEESKKSKRRKRVPFAAQLLIGLVLGLVLGFVAREWSVAWLGTTLETVGTLFVQLLFLIVPFLVFTAIVASIANLRNLANAGRLVAKTLGWFAVTSLIAVVIGIAIGLATNPGSGVELSSSAAAPETQGSWTDFLTGIVPVNVVDAFVNVNVLQIVFLAIVVGAAAAKLGDKAEPFLRFNASALALVQKTLWWVIRLAPIGTAALIGKSVFSYGWDLLEPMAVFSVDIYAGALIVMLVVYPVLLRVFGKVSPVQFFRKSWPAIQFAFVSRSSVGTLPLAQRIVTDRLGVDRNYASFASPFGATTKMDGCAAIYPAIAAIFVAQVYGVDLGVQDYLLIAFVSVIGSAATAGLTGATVMLTLTLSTLGLPLEGVGLLLAIDPIMDMIRTATNVTGQMVVPVIVARSERILDREVYDAAPVPLDEESAFGGDSAPARKGEPALQPA